MTKVNLSLQTLFSMRTPSVFVKFFPFNNNTRFVFGFDLTTHSNLASLSLSTLWSADISRSKWLCPKRPRLTGWLFSLGAGAASLCCFWIYQFQSWQIFCVGNYLRLVGKNSNVSFLKHAMLLDFGLDTNLQVNSASWPWLMFTFLTFANIHQRFFWI